MKNISIGIIGAGKVGTTAAFALMLKGYRGIFLYDINKERTRGEVMDLCDGSPGMCVIHQWDEIGKADIYIYLREGLTGRKTGWSFSTRTGAYASRCSKG